MRLTQRRKEGSFYFVVEQHAGRTPGGEVEMCVFSSNEGEGIQLLQRSLYFDEQSLQHIDNFCKEFAYDAHYREICIRGTAHWCRVARLYELNARIIIEDKKVQPKNINETCKELFHFIRRDLDKIESHPEYKSEMARISQGKEIALHDALALLAKVSQLEIASACQGSSSIQLGDRQIFLPSCHSERAAVSFTALPASFLRYLQSGPLGQQHLARLEPTMVSSIRVFHNRSFIRLLTASTLAYLRKYGSHPSTSPRHRK